MTPIEVLVLSLSGAWVLILSLVVLVLVREVAILRARMSLGSGESLSARDGPVIGRPVPELIQHEVLRDEPRAYLVLLSAICGPCHDLAKQLKTAAPLDEPLIAMVTGRAVLADQLSALLPAWVTVIRDPLALEAAKALSIQSTPFALHVRDARVTGKAYLHGARDLLRLEKGSEVLMSENKTKSEVLGHAS